MLLKKVVPNKKNCFELVVTTDSQLSHHDPAVTDGSNTLSFNRQLQLLERDVPKFTLAQDALNKFCAKFPVSKSLVDLIEQLPVEQFVATVTIKTLLDVYNNAAGSGLLDGLNRYSLLESRARFAAYRASTLRQFWSIISKDLQLSIHPTRCDELLISIFSLPLGIQRLALSALVNEHRSIVTIARALHTQEKSEKKDSDSADLVIAKFDASLASTEHRSTIPVEVPAVSANSLRHCIVREPSWHRLINKLKIENSVYTIKQGIEALFINGGNKAAGAKEPAGASALAIQIRKHYPSLDLLSGVADTFDLGEGMLSVSSHLVCAENRVKLGDALSSHPNAVVSAYDMMDTVTMTRQATQHGLHQMIFNQEVLASGVAVLVKLSLHPLTSSLSQSALASAVEEFASTPHIGGQAARGFGWSSCQWVGENYPSSDEYEQYLQDNFDFLRTGLIEGTLGTGVKLCQ